MNAKPAKHGRDHRSGGEDPIPGLQLRRLVYGSIYGGGGTQDEGSGDWEESTTGNVTTVTVDPPFNSAIKNVVVGRANQADSGDAPGFAVVDTSSSDVDQFVVKTFDFIGDPADSGYDWAFIAIEDV